MKNIDLHTHTTASDGSFSPAEVVTMAEEAGLHAVAITDHDTTAGVAEALAAGEDLTVEVVPGVELSVDHARLGSLHILGYWIEPGHPDLAGRLEDIRGGRGRRNQKILARLAELGCPADRAEVKKAVSAVLSKPKPNQADPYGIYDVRAFCLLGLTDQPKFRDLARAGLKRIMAREAEWSNIWEGCPWTPIEHLITLWQGRTVADVEPCVAKALKWIADGINDAGCLSYKDPWGFVRLASVVDHPLARRILEKEVPMLLRAQKPDGGWGDKSVIVFRALKKHGLLDKLRKRPALPADWRTL